MSNQPLDMASLEHNMYFFNLGNHFQAYEFLGARQTTLDGVTGYRFTVWAPNAKRVYVKGYFNDWQETRMEKVGRTGAWTVFIENAKEWDLYKYVIEARTGEKKEKQDPFAFAYEIAPANASIIQNLPDYQWQDQAWYEKRQKSNVYKEPLNIYEVHQSSWRRHEDGSAYTWADLADELIPYVKEMGYTHIEFMPLMEHPLEMSWGYQIGGYYALAGRYGTNFEHLMAFVDRAHQEGIGLIVDWVPGHFVVNDDAMAYYDGTPTFEYSDPNRANNIRWGSLNFDLGKSQVQSFLISNALFWLEKFHFDGIRVDSVSNILYLDYDEGPWTPNEYGNNVNLEGLGFLRKLNKEVFLRDPSYLMMAEESTAWPGVTANLDHGGIGFNFKWNMGWMNDTLKFFSLDPLSRKYNYKLITFTFMYMFDENFVLGLSHDEVVHGKHSLLGRMPGNSRYDQFCNLRVMEGYRMTYPGKKLTFMGNEIGQFLEWRWYSQLEWEDLNREFNSEYNHFVKSINELYLTKKALHQNDLNRNGISFLEADDADRTIVAYIRQADEAEELVVCVHNFTPVQRDNYRIGVPYPGTYQVILNSEMAEFGGNWEYQQEVFEAEPIPAQRHLYSIEVTLPSMATFLLEPLEIELIDYSSQADAVQKEKEALAKAAQVNQTKAKQPQKAKLPKTKKTRKRKTARK
ncbi:1,4-alpha-glucan branching enzyme [Aerococcus urinaehominis]|uniref:1,4-alpha-glucan branching protein GlgB n=1 Tax=Aerococcus urinaehominis TaxID=128944 RepID=UPI00087FBEA2|nr:1,4-alpha-glucan branching protein GlgB [Aerococcus urinaehominis]SDM13295.1 1,4-alpha-glucan branching enzyme [Aerococcus urinaehominis]